MSTPGRLSLAAFILSAALAGHAAWAAERLEVAGSTVQGGLVRGATEPGTRLVLDGRKVRVSPSGRFVFGFGRDAGPAAELTAIFADGDSETRRIEIKPRHYKIERVDGLPAKMVTPPPQVLERIRRENRLIAAVRNRDTAAEWFAADFTWPARGRISGVYGSQRVLNGKPRRPHFGLDVAAPVGTPVVAPAAGRVVLAETDLYYTGGTVMIDHGHGVTSIFMHLSALEVAEGEEVKQGDPIGRIGATGRATGPHLDWRVNWFGARLDPRLLVGDMPAP